MKQVISNLEQVKQILKQVKKILEQVILDNVRESKEMTCSTSLACMEK